MMSKQKVICIGSGRTGSTSLYTAMKKLGYRAAHLGHDRSKEKWVSGDVAATRAAFDDVDFMTDWPIWRDWRFALKCWPDAKYILTVRDIDEQMKSTLLLGYWCWVKHDDRWIASADLGAIRAKILDHNQEVIEHFGDSENFLCIDITKAQRPYKTLCDFLGEEHPGVPFPRVNGTKGKLQEIYRCLQS